MSGGAYDYAFFKVEEMAKSLRSTNEDPRRAAFKKLLTLVADAMHAIEWVDSCDDAHGDEHAAVDACFAFMGSDPSIITKAHAYESLREQLRKFMEIR
jgi:hypothetical protein